MSGAAIFGVMVIGHVIGSAIEEALLALLRWNRKRKRAKRA